MKVLIACEFSGIVRDAFKSKGHETTKSGGKHISGFCGGNGNTVGLKERIKFEEKRVVKTYA